MFGPLELPLDWRLSAGFRKTVLETLYEDVVEMHPNSDERVRERAQSGERFGLEEHRAKAQPLIELPDQAIETGG